MTLPLRHSPIFATSILDAAYTTRAVGLADCSLRPRWGVKGAGAAAWLAEQGFNPPPAANTWSSLGGSDVIARLGRTEFLLEGASAVHLADAVTHWPDQVYPVPRDDAAFVLSGARLPELLLQTCNINFRALDLTQSPVVLTSMVGVSVLLLPTTREGLPFYRLWCDYSYGNYLWSTLLGIVIELGGGVMDLPAEFHE